jgi:tight adherence protein C
MASYQILGPAFVGYVALVLGVLTYRIAIRPTREASRLGMRGLKRQRALLYVLGWADIEPFIRWMGVRLSGVLSDKQRAAFDQRLVFAGDYRGISPDEHFACIVCGALIGIGLGAGAAAFKPELGVIPAVVLGAFGGALPLVGVDQARQDRMKSINRGLPNAIDLIALAMSSGSDFPGAVRQVIEKAKTKDDALIDELAYLIQQLELGRTRSQALRDFMDRTPSEAVAEFVQAVIQAEERGNPLAGVLIVQADVARTRRTNAAESKAQDMRTKMIVPSLMLAACSFVYIAFATWDFVETLTHGMSDMIK